jgi:hypothetical protein
LGTAANALKCYVHQNVDAVGVCSSCGRGVCRVCAVRLGGKLYCKEDADKVFASKRVVVTSSGVQTGPKRGVGVIIGSIFAYLLGGTAAIVSFTVLFAAIVSGDTGGNSLFSSLLNPDLSFLGPIQHYSSSSILTIGIAMLIFGSLGIAAGFYTWKPAKAGAVFAVIFGILGLIVAFELASISVEPLLVDAWFALSGLTIVGAFVGFVQLTRSPRPDVQRQRRAVRQSSVEP